MLKRSPRSYWLVPAAALSLMGCPDEELAPLEPCTVSGVSEKITQSGSDQLDLLFVIDDSGSMKEEQIALERELPNLVKILTTGDLNLNGNNTDEGDFEPVASLHLGVVSTNMGTYGQLNIPNSNCEESGDDGVLLDEPSAEHLTDEPGCADVDIEKYQTFETKGVDNVEMAAQKVADDFACVAIRGTEGCGLEQQLEAMLKAVTPKDQGSRPDNQKVDFVEGNGHGGVANGSFVRDDAVLAIIHVSDEEDCSVTDKGKRLFHNPTMDQFETYNGPDEDFTGDKVGLNFQCANATDSPEDPTDLLQSADRFVQGLKALKPDNPDRIIFAGIVGVPVAAEMMKNGDIQDFEGILAMNEMKVLPGIDEDGMKSLQVLPLPACEIPDSNNDGKADTSASPARRFVEVASGFGENGVITSICNDSYKSALNQILTKISKKLTGACLPSALNPDNNGVVKCDVVEILGSKGKKEDCAASRGRKFKEMRDVEVAGEIQPRVVCDVNQVAVKDGDLVKAPNALDIPDPLIGWYYDNFTDEVKTSCPVGKQQRIATTNKAEPAEGASFAFECFNPVGGDIEKPGKAAVGAPCDPTASKCESDDDYKLSCEPITKTCQITCKAESNCPDGWVCDDAGGAKYCINPKCPPVQ